MILAVNFLSYPIYKLIYAELDIHARNRVLVEWFLLWSVEDLNGEG